MATNKREVVRLERLVLSVNARLVWTLKTHTVRYYRLLNSDNVSAVTDCATHFLVEVDVDSDDSVADVIERIKAIAYAPTRRGERVEEIFHEWGSHPFTYRYHAGD
jgi:hypothetical protein